MDIKTLQSKLTNIMVDYEVSNGEDIDLDEFWDLSIAIGIEGLVTGTKHSGGFYERDKNLITINLHVIENARDDGLSNKLIDNILKHELAHHIDHILRGTSKHDKIFKDICRAIGGMRCVNATTDYSADMFKD